MTQQCTVITHYTADLRASIDNYADAFGQEGCAAQVGNPEARSLLLQRLAGKAADTLPVTHYNALLPAQIAVWALEAVAGGYQPEQCSVATVAIDGQLSLALVVSVGAGNV